MKKKVLPYSVICISAYNDDLEEWDELVAECKSKGMTCASRSALIRYAMTLLPPVEEMPTIGARG
jgi:hypothetical protein